MFYDSIDTELRGKMGNILFKTYDIIQPFAFLHLWKMYFARGERRLITESSDIVKQQYVVGPLCSLAIL